MTTVQMVTMAVSRELFPGKPNSGGKRCLKFRLDEEPPEDVLRQCIALALTYHLNQTPDRLPFETSALSHRRRPIRVGVFPPVEVVQPLRDRARAV